MKNNTMHKRYENITPIGSMAFCNTFGVLIYEPDEIDKYKDNCELIAAWANVASGDVYGFHKHKIHYSTSGRPFIRKGSLRIYLDEVMRCY
jgi:hypothetical protein